MSLDDDTLVTIDLNEYSNLNENEIVEENAPWSPLERSIITGGCILSTGLFLAFDLYCAKELDKQEKSHNLMAWAYAAGLSTSFASTIASFGSAAYHGYSLFQSYFNSSIAKNNYDDSDNTFHPYHKF